HALVDRLRRDRIAVLAQPAHLRGEGLHRQAGEAAIAPENAMVGEHDDAGLAQNRTEDPPAPGRGDGSLDRRLDEIHVLARKPPSACFASPRASASMAAMTAA